MMSDAKESKLIKVSEFEKGDFKKEHEDRKKLDINILNTSEDIAHASEDLGHAIIGRNAIEVKRILSEGFVDVNQVDEEGNTLLQYAMELEDAEEIVKLLLEHGADCFDCHDARDFSSFRLIVHSGNVELGKILLENKKIDSYTFMKKVFQDIAPEERNLTAQFLKKCGFNFNKIDATGSSILIFSVLDSEMDGTFSKFLIRDCEIDVNIQNFEGKTALHLACLNSSKFTIAKILIGHGANIILEDRKGRNFKDYLIASKLTTEEFAKKLSILKKINKKFHNFL